MRIPAGMSSAVATALATLRDTHAIPVKIKIWINPNIILQILNS